MADPISIIGIVWTGKEVCGELVKYFKSWKNAPKDVIESYTSLEVLEGMFHSLHDKLLGGVLQDDDTDRVVACINRSNAYVGDLKAKLAKFRKLQS